MRYTWSRNSPGSRSSSFNLLSSVSLAALTSSAWLLGAGLASAANECGSPAGGVVSCNGATYPSITYNTSGADDLTLNLDNSSMVVSGPVLLQDTDASSTADLTIDVKNLGSITTSGSNGVRAITSGTGNTAITFGNGTVTASGNNRHALRSDITNTASTANASITVNGGDLSASGENANAAYAYNTGNGNATITVNGGTLSASGKSGYGAFAYGAGAGDSIVKVTGGTISTTGYAGNAVAAYSYGTGNAVITMDASSGSAPSISTDGIEADGLYAWVRSTASGAAAASVTMSGGSIVTTGANNGYNSADAVIAQIDSATSTGTATVLMTGGSIETYGEGGTPLTAQTQGLGAIYIQMDGGSIETANAWAILGNLLGATNTETATAIMNGGTITTAGDGSANSSGIFVEHLGLGDVLVQMNGGSITTTGAPDSSPAGAYGIWGATLNQDSSATSVVELNGGNITTEGYLARGILSNTWGTGDVYARITGGSVETHGDEAYGMHAGNTAFYDPNGTGTTYSIMTGGSITTTGDQARGISVANYTAGDAVLIMNASSGNAASVTTSGSEAHGLYAHSTGTGNASLGMDGGTVTVSGADSFGASAYTASGLRATLTLTGGAIYANDDALGAVGFIDRTSESGAATNALVTIGPGMTIDASGSTGNHAIYNDDDQAATSIAVTTSGTVTGSAMMGGGRSTFTLAGGSWTGNIYGDFDPVETPTVNQGSDNFIWTGGSLNSGFYGQGGNDTATISVPNSASFASAIFDGGEDGGAPQSAISSDIDEITFAGNNDGLVGANIQNWEKFTVDNNATVAFADGSMTLDGYDGGNANGMGLATIMPGATLMGGLQTPFSLNANLVNSGMVSMRDGVTSGHFIVNGDYNSDGGHLGLDVDFYNLQSDVVTFGGAIDGLSRLDIADVTGANRARFGAILVADSTNATSIDQNEFTVETGTKTASGLYAYSLYYNLTGDPNIGSTPGLYLYADPDSIQPFIPLYEGYQSALLEMNKLPTMRQRVGKRYWDYDDAAASDGANPAAPGLDAVWGRIDGGFDHIDPSSSTLDYDYDLSQFEAQAGLDGLFLDNENGRLIAGLTGHYRTGEAKFSSRYGASKMTPDGWGLGGTLTWLGENGFYTDAQVEATWYSADMKADALYNGIEDSDAFGYALSLEAGQQIGFGSNNMIVTPQAQLMWSSVDVDSFTGAYNDDADFNNGDALTARLGLALEHESHWKDEGGLFRKGNVYGIANLYYDFDNKTKTTVEQVYALETELDAWTGEIGFGGSYDWAGANDVSYGVYAELTASMGFESSSYGYGGNLGFKVRW